MKFTVGHGVEVRMWPYVQQRHVIVDVNFKPLWVRLAEHPCSSVDVDEPAYLTKDH
jgi:hypothetical protein